MKRFCSLMEEVSPKWSGLAQGAIDLADTPRVPVEGC
jgi:hypothetical protein